MKYLLIYIMTVHIGVSPYNVSQLNEKIFDNLEQCHKATQTMKKLSNKDVQVNYAYCLEIK